MAASAPLVLPFTAIDAQDVALVGGKNASLGEMIRSLGTEGIRVPDGFATTADAFRLFIAENGLAPAIHAAFDDLHAGRRRLDAVGTALRSLVGDGVFPVALERDIRDHYRELCARSGVDDVDVAVRSSATAEDLPNASFAGQHESYLNVRGEEALLAACRDCFASLFTDRAISYREAQGFDHLKVALSVGVQRMIRSDLAGAGVLFTVETETGYPDATVLNAAWGLGESVVKGRVDPDEFIVYAPFLDRTDVVPIIERKRGAKERKLVYATGDGAATMEVETTPEERGRFVLTDAEVLRLARWGKAIERHYGREMDVEWAKDGQSDALFIVQARPETVASRQVGTSLRTYRLRGTGSVLAEGLAIGSAVATGQAQVILRPEDIERFRDGAILVTSQTDPDWVPIMKRAAGIVTNHGGRTSHAAIVSRELGVPAIVGAGDATRTIMDGQDVTLSCIAGDQGQVYDGILDVEVVDTNLADLPQPRTRIMINMASPAAAFRWWRLPTRGIGLARMEFIISDSIKVHPMALARFDAVTDPQVRQQIEALTAGYADKTDFFVERLALGIAKLAAPHYPEPVIVRMSDFKTNEYANLIGGTAFEPVEANPMLGFRGASRYYSERYRAGFALGCRAIRKVREEIGLDNVAVMIPFCRTVDEADRVLGVMAEQGLRRGERGLKVYVMAEIPANVILARAFATRFDGFSIGSNDLTQLVLGIDRDSAELAPLFDERDEAVKQMIAMLIRDAHASRATVGICGEAPSNYPEFAAFLVAHGIDSISLNPDRVLDTIPAIVAAERVQQSAKVPAD
jgi:pyruvate,water dikinase